MKAKTKKRNVKKFPWRRGEKTKLARFAQISPQHLNAILNRKKGVGIGIASLLSIWIRRHYPKNYVDITAFVCNKISKNIIFVGKPIKTKIK